MYEINGESMDNVNYSKPETPAWYICSKCKIGGIRLYRQYITSADQVELLCREHALLESKMVEPDGVREHSIGWLVSAIPTEDGKTYLGYTYEPVVGVIWWESLKK